MQALLEIGNARAYGTHPIAGWAKFTQNGATNAAQTLTENFGIVSVTKTGTGLWTCVLQDLLPGWMPIVQVAGASTLCYLPQIIAVTQATKQFTFCLFKAPTPATPVFALDDGASAVFSIFIYGRGSIA